MDLATRPRIRGRLRLVLRAAEQVDLDSATNPRSSSPALGSTQGRLLPFIDVLRGGTSLSLRVSTVVESLSLNPTRRGGGGILCPVRNVFQGSPRLVLVSLQSRSETAGGDAWRHDAAGSRAAIGTDQAMESILVHERFETQAVRRLGGSAVRGRHPSMDDDTGGRRSACSRWSSGPVRGDPGHVRPWDMRVGRRARAPTAEPVACVSVPRGPTRAAWTSWWS